MKHLYTKQIIELFDVATDGKSNDDAADNVAELAFAFSIGVGAVASLMEVESRPEFFKRFIEQVELHLAKYDASDAAFTGGASSEEPEGKANV